MHHQNAKVKFLTNFQIVFKLLCLLPVVATQNTFIRELE